MILVFKSAADNLVASARDRLDRLGLSSTTITTGSGCLLVVLDDVSTYPTHLFSQIKGVDRLVRIAPQCSLVFKNGSSSISIGNVQLGGGKPVVIAGPCSVEGEAQIIKLAFSVKEAGATMLRGGAFKPRSSPYDFQGLGVEGLRYLAAARGATGLPIVSEVMSVEHVEQAHDYIDVFQIGARNMYNYELLKEVGRAGRPVMLKRAMSATLQEFINAAEYIMLQGNMQVILCERGIRTFETHTRNTLDLNTVAALKHMTPLPVIVDPSHGTGRRELVRPMSRAAIACGADGLMIEVHHHPNEALSDADQALTPEELRLVVKDVTNIHAALQEPQAFAFPQPVAVPPA